MQAKRSDSFAATVAGGPKGAPSLCHPKRSSFSLCTASFDFNNALADELRKRRRYCVANEAPSATVQPSGNPIRLSHSSQVKFLATENWSICVTALMSTSLGT